MLPFTSWGLSRNLTLRNFEHPHNPPVNWGRQGGKVAEGVIYQVNTGNRVVILYHVRHRKDACK